MVCVDNKFSKLFKTYLGKDAVYNFINKTLKKVNINKEVEMIKEDNEDFKNPTKWWIYRNYYVDVDIKVRDHCHINGKYRGSAHRDRNINLRFKSQNSCHISQPKKSWFSSYNARTRQIQF